MTSTEQTKRDQVRALAESLLAEYGLADWRVEWDGQRERAGRCNYRRRVVNLSSPLMTLWPWDEVDDTIRHEIAHALTPGAKHGPEWQAMCRRIGAVPVARYDGESLPRAAEKYVGTCPNGHKIYRNAKPRKPRSCGTCSEHYDPRYTFTYTLNVQERS